MRPRPLAFAVISFVSAMLASAAPAQSQEADKPKIEPVRARWHPEHLAEIEPHFVVGGLDKYDFGLGLGANITFPVWDHAPFKYIDDTLGFGVGLDVVRYASYQPQSPSGNNVRVYAVYVPVYAQWSFWMGSRVSIFLEPTLLYRFSSYDGNCNDVPCASKTRVLPTGSIGLRFRILERLSGTIRVGWPMFTLGASWL